ncbi:phosphate ABC transporter permease subunit PstC [Coprobacter tertius]|uniref:Phosphate transport system permease protein n=1 Tax=Coprobacter tertius TaxID=2944915 RepID=A0ABT1MHI2_9BACT|nr:phosphate ABC transporter permease subunit PstC [Coprobacter tertius]MCP9611819.1 phosphate ABC transporter permease subunit PstC [Coprobacter tertius]
MGSFTLTLSRWRIFKDKLAGSIMLMLTLFMILLVIVIAMGLYMKSIPIFEERSLVELLTSARWKPLKGEFGFLPFIMGTLWVTAVALVLALPIALLSAIFLNEYARKWVKKVVFPTLDILAGIPSVVYGVWGILIIIPWISDKLAPHFVEYSTGYSVLAGGIVLGVMILPLLVSMFIEIFSAVPDELRDASTALGATKWQTTKSVLLRKTAPGILAAVMLAMSRAFGETIAVLMVCGNITKIPDSIFDGCYPLPALIANNYGEMLSLPMYESALMLAAFILFFVVLLFNLVSRIILRHIEKRFQ